MGVGEKTLLNGVLGPGGQEPLPQRKPSSSEASSTTKIQDDKQGKSAAIGPRRKGQVRVTLKKKKNRPYVTGATASKREVGGNRIGGRGGLKNTNLTRDLTGCAKREHDVTHLRQNALSRTNQREVGGARTSAGLLPTSKEEKKKKLDRDWAAKELKNGPKAVSKRDKRTKARNHLIGTTSNMKTTMTLIKTKWVSLTQSCV